MKHSFSYLIYYIIWPEETFKAEKVGVATAGFSLFELSFSLVSQCFQGEFCGVTTTFPLVYDFLYFLHSSSRSCTETIEKKQNK